MSHHVATLQSAFNKNASVLDFAEAPTPGLRFGEVKWLLVASTGHSSLSLMFLLWLLYNLTLKLSRFAVHPIPSANSNLLSPILE